MVKNSKKSRMMSLKSLLSDNRILMKWVKIFFSLHWKNLQGTYKKLKEAKYHFMSGDVTNKHYKTEFLNTSKYFKISYMKHVFPMFLNPIGGFSIP